jgi:N utilization substance protein A
MAKNDFALAFNEVLEEKQLAKDDGRLGRSSRPWSSAYRRAVGASTAQHVEAKLDPETGVRYCVRRKRSGGRQRHGRTHRSVFDEARKVNPEAQPGDMVIVESTPADFGRVAAQTARQVIQQRIREAERSNQMSTTNVRKARSFQRFGTGHQRPGQPSAWI